MARGNEFGRAAPLPVLRTGLLSSLAAGAFRHPSRPHWIVASVGKEQDYVQRNGGTRCSLCAKQIALAGRPDSVADVFATPLSSKGSGGQTAATLKENSTLFW